jgi:hypothetical protein
VPAWRRGVTKQCSRRIGSTDGFPGLTPSLLLMTIGSILATPSHPHSAPASAPSISRSTHPTSIYQRCAPTPSSPICAAHSAARPWRTSPAAGGSKTRPASPGSPHRPSFSYRPPLSHPAGEPPIPPGPQKTIILEEGLDGALLEGKLTHPPDVGVGDVVVPVDGADVKPKVLLLLWEESLVEPLQQGKGRRQACQARSRSCKGGPEGLGGHLD